MNQKMTLLELREQHGYSLATVQKKCGVEPAALSRSERGMTILKLENVIRLLDLYDVKFEDVDWLLEGETEQTKKTSV